jgi:hypothetical protein
MITPWRFFLWLKETWEKMEASKQKPFARWLEEALRPS